MNPTPVTLLERGPIPETKRADWQSDQEVRWCPGCGDYSILAALQFALPEMAVRREDVVVVGGIGCAARFPYYMNTYGLHGIHGRAPAIATGIALANPDLHVFVVGGDGDLLSIGGNHLLHALRRNVNLTILLFNNRIYGLTKGQYSPTSEVGKVTKSTPRGSEDSPLIPMSVALGADATFVARTHDMDRKHMMEVFSRAHAHQGAAFVEVLQNCNVFNDGAYDAITARANRDDMIIPLVHGEPILLRRRAEPRVWCSIPATASRWSTSPMSASTPSWSTTRPAPIRASRSPSAAWRRARPSRCRWASSERSSARSTGRETPSTRRHPAGRHWPGSCTPAPRGR